MGVTIEIEEWTPTKKFYGGELIKGAVVMNNHSGKTKLLNHVLVIKFLGRAEAAWKEQRKNVSHFRQYLTTVFEHESYLDESVTLQNLDTSIHNREILPGITEYPFLFRLPMGLPESFKSENGSVTYRAEVPYPKSWAVDNAIKLDFLVGAHVDLNYSPREWLQPGQFAMHKRFWWGRGSVEAQLSLPTRAFCPLDIINFTLEVANKSNTYLKKIRVYFCQVTTYHAKGSEFKEGKRLSKIKCKSVFPKGNALIQGTIQVPDIPPTELGGCRLVQPQYGIMIKVISATLGKMIKAVVLEGRVPVLIGTIPVGRMVTERPQTTQFIRSDAGLLHETTEFTSRAVTLTREDPEAFKFTDLTKELGSMSTN